MTQLPAAQGRTLVILVLNRPDSDSDPQANAELRTAIVDSPLQREQRGTVSIHCLNPHTDLYLLDMEALYGPTPAALGVGLARKTGCDLALQWMAAGGISGQWLCCTDADATLPPDYFEQLGSAAPDAVAAVFPFRHVPGEEPACDTATSLYELRLRHYVLGLEYAGSTYAYHTLGSCLAIRASAYAHVRGFPQRAGAEDFYLLNKLAKLGPIARLSGSCIAAAVTALFTGSLRHRPGGGGHPQRRAAARGRAFLPPALFRSAQGAARGSARAGTRARTGHGATVGQARHRRRLCRNRHSMALAALGIEAALAHCQRQSTSSDQFQRQFHQWFDGFRTLKFIHAIRAAGWPDQSLTQLDTLQPQLWPTAAEPPCAIDQLRQAIGRHWAWQ